MFLLSKWNQTKTYDYAIERDFGTDYGICCWYTPQLNFTEIDIHTHENHLHEPDWGHWFMNVPKVENTYQIWVSQKRLDRWEVQNCWKILNNKQFWNTKDLPELKIRIRLHNWKGYLLENRDVLFEFHLKCWNTASTGIPVRSLL